MSESSSNRSILKALVYFLFGAIVLVVPVVSALANLSPYEQGRLIGHVTIVALIPAAIVGVLSSRSDSEYGWLKFGLIYVLLFVGCNALTTVSSLKPSERPAISEAEGSAPEFRGQSLCQQAIPFSVGLPSSAFSPLPDRWQEGSNVRVWVWESSETGERILVQAIKGSRSTSDDFREFMRGVRSGAGESAELHFESIDTDSVPYRADLGFTLENGVSLDQRCLSHGASQSPGWTVCLSTVSVDPESLEAVRSSFQLAPC